MSDQCNVCLSKTPNVNPIIKKDKRGRTQRHSTCGKCGRKKCGYIKANKGDGLFTDVANQALKTASKADLFDVINAVSQTHKVYKSADKAYQNVKNRKYK